MIEQFHVHGDGMLFFAAGLFDALVEAIDVMLIYMEGCYARNRAR